MGTRQLYEIFKCLKMSLALFKPKGGLLPSEWRWWRSGWGSGRLESGGKAGEEGGEIVVDMYKKF